MITAMAPTRAIGGSVCAFSRRAFSLFVVVITAAGQSADARLSDSRLTVHTLLREDIFAWFLGNNMARIVQSGAHIES